MNRRKTIPVASINRKSDWKVMQMNSDTKQNINEEESFDTYPEAQMVQEVELDILTKFAEACDKLGLTYFLDGGTLLGAVRHEGFIPWDDDVDVGMPRKDYEEFLKHGQVLLGDDYFLQTTKTDPAYPGLFAKIRKNGTRFIEWNQRNLKMNKGIYIDIFPYDKLPMEGRREYADAMRKLTKQYLIRSIPDRCAHNDGTLKWWVIAIARRLEHYVYCLRSKKKLAEKIDREFVKYNDEEFEEDYCTCHAFLYPIWLRESMIYPVKKIGFCGKEFSAPIDHDTYLKEMYGDYMKIPPKEERIGHRPVDIYIGESE